MATAQQFNNLNDLLSESNLPLLVVFYASWCGPSHLMDTILGQVKTQLGDQLQILKLDSEVYSNLASQYHVHPLPTLLLFKDGELAARIEEEKTENLMPAERLIERLRSLLYL